MSRNLRYWFVVIALAMSNIACATHRTPAVGGRQSKRGSDVQTGAADAANPIARVLEREIFAADLHLEPRDQCRELAGLISEALIDEFRAQRGIVVTDDEVRVAQAAMSRLIDEVPGPKPRGPMPDVVARYFLQQWKTDRELYECYGGVVIFQQGDPLEPIGAYRALLEEQYAARRFEIFDEKYRRCFWDLYRTERQRALPIEEIDYSQPWWMALSNDVRQK